MTAPRTYRQARFTTPPGATELVLIRHGESEPAVEGQSFAMVDGQGDPALSPEGRAQAERVCARLVREHFDAVYVTTLRRTVETASNLLNHLGMEPAVEPDLREVFLGEWEGGELRSRAANADPIAMQMLTEERWELIPGAESTAAFSARVGGAIERITVAHPDQRVAVFCHGGTIGQALSLATGSRPFAFLGADNASISQLVVMEQRWVLRRFNDTTHLDIQLSTQPSPLT